MKTYEKITIVTILLAIVVLILASFLGVYVLKTFKVSNIIPNYDLGMEFSEKRVAECEVDTSVKENKIYDSEGNLVVEQEEGVEYTEENGYKIVDIMMNDEAVLTTENYKNAEDIFKNKLYTLGATQYTLNLNEENGKITVEIPENDDTDYILGNLGQSGEFSITDYETGEVLLNQENLKLANITYGAGSEVNETMVYLYLQFDKEGTEKLKNITETYAQTEETSENGKFVNLSINGQVYMEKTAFPEEYVDGILYLTLGSSSNEDEIQQYIETGAAAANNLNAGFNPIAYTISSYTKESIIDENLLNTILYIFIGLNIVSFAYFIMKFKKAGIMATILQLGYVAVLLLIVRFLSITITVEGIIGILISIVLNYIFTYMTFKATFINKKTMKEVIKHIFGSFTLRMIPIYIIAVVFTFTGLLYTSSLGMTLVWGTIIVYLYNVIFTNILLRMTIKED